MNDLTILYITDSILDKHLAERCRELLLGATNGHRVISVSQEPLNFGENICVGKLPRVALSIDIQIREGLESIKTKYVALAEHDCIYSEEHFRFVPPDSSSFWYNDNCWLVQLRNDRYPQYDGMYSYFPKRRVQSQLICSTRLLAEAMEDKIAILSHPGWIDTFPRGRIGEPGTNSLSRTKRLLIKNKDLGLAWKRIKRYITVYSAKDWKSKIPNLDIRHGQNFTGQRRGRRRTWDLPPWGKFENVLNGP